MVGPVPKQCLRRTYNEEGVLRRILKQIVEGFGFGPVDKRAGKWVIWAVRAASITGLLGVGHGIKRRGRG